jgi:hypothetical protein
VRGRAVDAVIGAYDAPDNVQALRDFKVLEGVCVCVCVQRYVCTYAQLRDQRWGMHDHMDAS